MDVVVWLRSLGLGKYEAAFRENEIDETVLPNLTAEDLKDLGVGIVGHRRKILDAITALRSDAEAKEPLSEVLPHAPAPAQASTPPPTAEPAAEAIGERRYLTVMFCDLVGSTSISAQLDAEEWRDLVGAYLDAATAAVTEMGGHVAKKLGDGLMALFGYPAAQENDAERAARAALSIQRALAEVNNKHAAAGKPALNARIGIETGPVVVDVAGEIYGDAPNVAARVQTLAEPGTVLVTAGVQRQIAGLFIAEDRGSHELKGVSEPVALFRLVRASGARRRSGQRHLTPLVGRDEEIAILMRRWGRARQGEGQLVLIVGEPGLGKSRLIEEFHARLRDTPHSWVEWSCSQLLQNTPLHPIADWGRQRFGGADVPAEQRALDQIATMPGTPALRREQINIQVALITPLVHIKGYSAPETKAAIEQARLLLEQADALGETPSDPLQLFEVLYGAFVANVMAFNADVSRDIAAQVLELAEKQSASFPRVLGHNHLGGSLMLRGEIAEARAHLDQALALYDPAEQRSLATRFGEDQTVATLSMRPWVLWLLGYPDAALRDIDEGLKNARETGQAASLMFALHFTAVPLILCGNYSRATALAQELCALADEKDLPFWRVNGSLYQGSLFALTGDASNAVQMITSGITAVRPTGVTAWMPRWLSYLAIAHANLDQIDDAWRCIGEAISTIETTKERWFEAETNRVAGEIAMKSPEPDAAKVEAHFERALAVARQQQAKSWELRASMSLARFWRSQGKVQQARELLAPVYGWFTEGFDTRDLKEAKALLEELAA